MGLSPLEMSILSAAADWTSVAVLQMDLVPEFSFEEVDAAVRALHRLSLLAPLSRDPRVPLEYKRTLQGEAALAKWRRDMRTRVEPSLPGLEVA